MKEYYLSKRIREEREAGMKEGGKIGRKMGRKIGREIEREIRRAIDRESGMEEGRKQGIEEGYEQGRQKGFFDGAKAFVMASISRDSAADYIYDMVQQCFKFSREDAEKLYKKCKG